MGLLDKLDKLGEYFCNIGFHKDTYKLAEGEDKRIRDVICGRCNKPLGKIILEQDPTQPFQPPYNKNERIF